MSDCKEQRTMFIGADPTHLDRLALSFEGVAGDLERMAKGVTVQLRRTSWDGPDAEDMRQQWHGYARQRMTIVAGTLREGATTLRRNAEDQRRASAAEGGSGSRAGGSGSPSANGPDLAGAIKGLREVLGAIGVGKTVLDLLEKQLQYTDPALVKSVTDLLGQHPAILDTLKIFGEVVGIGKILADFTLNWIDKAHLPFDERLLHSLVYVGAGVAAAKGTKWVVAKIGAAVGTAATPLGTAVGAIGGFALGTVISESINAFGLKEGLADFALDRYREAKDLGAEIRDRVTGTVDAVVDGAEAMVEVGGNIIGSGVNEIAGWFK